MSSEYFNDNQKSNINNSSILTEEIKVCSICLEPVEYKKLHSLSNSQFCGLIYILCGHSFHIECFFKINDDKCPLCRYNLSPISVTSCSLCSCENDLWICLICGAIFCANSISSNNHRKEHYDNTGHIYYKGIGEYHNTTFDFSKGCNLNQWFQNSLAQYNEFSNINDISLLGDCKPEIKDPKEKVEFIVSEYNSIISSQLESQRLYYKDYKNKIEINFLEDNFKLDKELKLLEDQMNYLDNELLETNSKKSVIFEAVKLNEKDIKIKENEFDKTEKEYKTLLENRDKLNLSNFSNFSKISNELDKEINDLNNQIKDIKTHINAKNKLNKQNISALEGSMTIINMDNKNKRHGNKK